MASIGHVAVGLAARRLYERRVTPRWAPITSAVVWSVLSLLPDGDVIGFRFGVRYAAEWGHRGATHSLVFAVAVGGLAYVVARAAGLPRLRTTVLAALVVASHGVLDCFTDGGLGAALLWPFSKERFFAPLTPIPVAPIGRAFFSMRGLRVAAAELLIFAPAVVYALWPRGRGRAADGG